MTPINSLGTRLYLLHELVTLFYSLPECIVGGPLHILLDDGNVRDSDLASCYEYAAEEKWKHCRELAICILDMLSTLSLAQRLYWHGYRSAEDVLLVAGKDIEFSNGGYQVKEQ